MGNKWRGGKLQKQLHVVYGAYTCNNRVRGTDGAGGELPALYHYYYIRTPRTPSGHTVALGPGKT